MQYQVVPVLGEPGGSHPDLAQASPWTDPVTCGTGTTAGFDMWFTRGIVAAPSVDRAVQAIIDQNKQAGRPATSPHDVLHDEISTGSHNLGKKASSENDDNLVIVTGASGLAREYAVYIQVVFDAYKWRYERGQRSGPGANTWSGLARDDTWQDGHAGQPAYTEVARPQVQFWLGSAP